MCHETANASDASRLLSNIPKVEEVQRQLDENRREAEALISLLRTARKAERVRQQKGGGNVPR